MYYPFSILWIPLADSLMFCLEFLRFVREGSFSLVFFFVMFWYLVMLASWSDLGSVPSFSIFGNSLYIIGIISSLNVR